MYLAKIKVMNLKARLAKFVVSCYFYILMCGFIIRAGTAFLMNSHGTPKRIQHHHRSCMFSFSPCKNVAIVGGGLAGLSTAYHLLEKLGGNVRITVLDKAGPGEGGASAVAGG
jgi:NADPH-dependent 2,4-dienoyl-CoA reductase/sulfur reductase-like enzyme